jgi:UDP-N-acetylglucosamine diphosphorylase/glucosamine-1-phosphate N-acetyltransferase
MMTKTRRLCLVEDRAVADLEPLTLTRPAYALRLGTGTLADRLLRAFDAARGEAHVGAIIRPYLAPIEKDRHPNLVVNDETWLVEGPTTVIRARWLPPRGFVAPMPSQSWVGLCQGRPACAAAPATLMEGLRPGEVDDWFETIESRLRRVDVGGEWIDRPWDLVARNDQALADDYRIWAGPRGREGLGLHGALVGPDDRLSVHDSARIDPYTVFDTTNGPITIEAGVWVQPFTRVEGPCIIGRDTHLFRANVRGGVTIGPTCRIGGEVEASIIHGCTNKYHEGFLGHAYVGEWVNLGAITSNSDLRNDYGEVQVPLQGDPVPTGMAKVGCFLGDHTRTGLGSMLNTGTVVGVMCNVLPAGPLLPKHVPSFAAVLYGKVAPGFPLEQMFATARTVKGRRGQEFTAAEEQLYLDLYEQTRLERERAFFRAQTCSRSRLDPEYSPLRLAEPILGHNDVLVGEP